MAHVLTAETSHVVPRRTVRADHVVMAVAAAALLVLVVLPLASLAWGSVSEDGRPTLAHFREALSSRLYVRRSGTRSSSGSGRPSSASSSACRWRGP
jgi:hypothetical protein